ncbi:Rrf2 family transcriptional regulator [Streptomyces coelicolor]|uniref:Rrf2 family transcriptional regulator n=1 Tax=Streptomyces toyocaensis TaxID=55952 RepID=Q8KLK9_STRTO|nr:MULTISPECIES: Rrf2 family transcriptional regulator [Streptomyces]AAM80543.1 StaS [Streptomyces toyocaensis]KES08703.1 Rrf2 family transcriptional regulator [Streptomyces toyocaensis]NSL78869.1 Rrf2 family transcriptional regulator [Streptomyces coelicolor]QKN67439.1 Rrf2 family transcriptional regulator [Streptomyces coelicolor]
MRITARTDYAVRAMAELAAEGETPLTAEELSARQDIPVRFLFGILRELRLARLVHSVRGPQGGYLLASAAEEITLAAVIRAVDGPLASVRELSLTGLEYPGPAAVLPDVWRAVRTSLRQVLETTTLADLARGELPEIVRSRAEEYRTGVRDHEQ